MVSYQHVLFRAFSSILPYTEADYDKYFLGPYEDDDLIEGALEVIRLNAENLRIAERKYRLDDLLRGMIQHAPHRLGKRHVSIVLDIAYNKGPDTMADVGRAWFEHLLAKMKAISQATKTEPSSSQTPTLNDTAAHIENVTRAQQPTLRSQAEATRTWDMLRLWTNLDLEKLVDSKVNTPANATFMDIGTHRQFGRFGFYLEKDAFPSDPNKYGLRVLDSFKMFDDSMVVEFATTDDLDKPINPPDPEFLRIHAAFAQVLHLSGAADYLESVEREADDYGTLAPTGETDIGLLLSSRLAVTAH